MTEEALSVRNLHVSYGPVSILKDINFSISRGQAFGLVGLNGAGKTTMIKAILALRAPQEGEIRIFGQAPGNMQVRYDTAYLPERFNPSWFLSGMEFLRFSLRLYKKPFDRNLAVRAAEKLALDPEALGRRVNTYSKGMRQKLGLIATLMTPCNFLILDEPMSGLDPYARALMKNTLKEARQEGRTFLMCSHILSDIHEICDIMSVMDKGELVFTGAPAELLRQGGSQDLEQAFLNMVVPRKAA